MVRSAKSLNGSLAQLVERHVYTVDVIGSIPVGPTTGKPRGIKEYHLGSTGFSAFTACSHHSQARGGSLAGVGPSPSPAGNPRGLAIPAEIAR